MLAGKLNEIIEIHSPMNHKNEYGEVDESRYELKYSTKAQTVYNGGKRNIDNEEVFIGYEISFIVRFYHNVDEKDRIRFNGNFYQINSIERNRQYQLLRINCSQINE